VDASSGIRKATFADDDAESLAPSLFREHPAAVSASAIAPAPASARTTPDLVILGPLDGDVPRLTRVKLDDLETVSA
jgi:hypothetical protein